MILDTIFLWTGGMFLILLVVLGILITVYYIWDYLFRKIPFYFRASWIAFRIQQGKLADVFDDKFIDKDGVKFKLVEIKEEEKAK